MKKLDSTQSKIGVSDEDPIHTPMSCRVNTGMLGEIEGFGYPIYAC